MVLKAIKWFLIAVLIAVVVVATVLGIGASRSMDHDYRYTQAFDTLAEFSSATTDGLVRIKGGAYEFRARVAGFEAGNERPGVILLHGFPVTSAMWASIIQPLADAGYRVVAFDQRGYSPGARPSDVENYVIPELVSDVLAVADAVGFEEFHLVGHDWGAIVGWNTVMTEPDRIITWTALSIAHPTAFGDAVRNDPDQKSRSSYFYFFITPWLPETLFSYNDFEMLKGIYSSMAAPQRQEYLEVFSEPGALTAALNWYRGMLVDQSSAEEPDIVISTPTLFIWGNKDFSAGRVAVDSQTEFIVGPYKMLELPGSHWLMEEFPEQTTEAIIEHLYTYGDRNP